MLEMLGVILSIPSSIIISLLILPVGSIVGLLTGEQELILSIWKDNFATIIDTLKFLINPSLW